MYGLRYWIFLALVRICYSGEISDEPKRILSELEANYELLKTPELVDKYVNLNRMINVGIAGEYEQLNRKINKDLGRTDTHKYNSKGKLQRENVEINLDHIPSMAILKLMSYEKNPRGIKFHQQVSYDQEKSQFIQELDLSKFDVISIISQEHEKLQSTRNDYMNLKGKNGYYSDKKKLEKLEAKQAKNFDNGRQKEIDQMKTKFATEDWKFAANIFDSIRQGDYVKLYETLIRDYQVNTGKNFDIYKKGLVDLLGLAVKNDILTPEEKMRILNNSEFDLTNDKNYWDDIPDSLKIERQNIIGTCSGRSGNRRRRSPGSVGPTCLVKITPEDQEKLKNIENDAKLKIKQNDEELKNPQEISRNGEKLGNSDETLKFGQNDKIPENDFASRVVPSNIDDVVKLKIFLNTDGFFKGMSDLDPGHLRKTHVSKSLLSKSLSKFKNTDFSGKFSKFSNDFAANKAVSKFSKLNYAFLFKNLARGIRNNDTTALVTTGVMFGVGIGGNYLEKSTKTFLKNTGELMGKGLDVVGIGFDLKSLADNIKCLKQIEENEEICQYKTIKKNNPNSTALAVYESPKKVCQDKSEICDGRNVILDIFADSASIILSTVGLFCAPCMPFTMAADLAIRIITEGYQAGQKVHDFNKYIKLTDGEKVGQFFRNLIGFGFSQYLEDLKASKIINIKEIKMLKEFLQNNTQYARLIHPTKNLKINVCIQVKRNNSCFKTESSCSDEFFRPDVIEVNLSFNNYNWECTENKLCYIDRNVEGDFFCPPISREYSSVKTIYSGSYYCNGAYGVEEIENRTGNLTRIDLGVSHESRWTFDTVYGDPIRPNDFNIYGGRVRFYGGEKNDRFFIMGDATGEIDGASGNNLINLQYYQGVQDQYFLDFRPEHDMDEWSNFKIKNIQSVIGGLGKAEKIICGCETSQIYCLGGENGENLDEIIIPRNINMCNKPPKMYFKFDQYTSVTNEADVGQYDYEIDDLNHSNQILSVYIENPSNYNSTHNIYFEFDYTEIKIISVAPKSLNHFEMKFNNFKINFNTNFSHEIFNQHFQLLTKLTENYPSAKIEFNENEDFTLQFYIDQENAKDIKYFQGSESISNTFIIKSGLIHGIKGGSFLTNDTFIRFPSKNFEKLSIDGGAGEKNSLIISKEMSESNEEIYINFKEKKISCSGNNFIHFENIQNIHGNQNYSEFLQINCHGKFVNLNGGYSVESPDLIEISNENCANVSTEIVIRLAKFSRILNEAEEGKFTYIVPQMGGINITILKNSPICQHRAILSFGHLEIENILEISSGGLEIILSKYEKINIFFEKTSDNLEIFTNPQDNLNHGSYIEYEEHGRISFVFEVEEISNSRVFQGHHKISNTFLIKSYTSHVYGGNHSNDVFIVYLGNFIASSNGSINGNGFENMLILNKKIQNYFDKICIDTERGILNFGGNLMLFSNIQNFQGLEKHGEEIIVSDSTKSINLFGGTLNNFDKIQISKNFTSSDSESTLIIFLHKYTSILNCAQNGSFIYEIQNSEEFLTEISFSNDSHAFNQISINLPFSELKQVHCKPYENILEIIFNNSITLNITSGLSNFFANEKNIIYIKETPSSGFPSVKINCQNEAANLIFVIPQGQSEDIKGHRILSNHFIIGPSNNVKEKKFSIIGGLNTDTFVINDYNSNIDRIDGYQGENILVCHTQVHVNFSRGVLQYDKNDGVNMTIKITNFGYIQGMMMHQMDQIITNCGIKFIDLKSDSRNECDTIIIPDNCPTYNMTIVLGECTLVTIGAKSGHFNYELNFQNNSGNMVKVFCSEYDEENEELCPGTEQRVSLDMSIDDIRDISINQSQVILVDKDGGNNTFKLLYENSMVNYSNIIQKYFTFITNENIEISINSMGGIMAVQNSHDCLQDLEEFIFDNKVRAVQLELTMLINCGPKMVILIGGDMYVDYFENLPQIKTYLIGNEGYQSVFKISPSNEVTYIYITPLVSNILDLTSFYLHLEFDEDNPIIAPLIEQNGTYLQFELSSINQKIILIDGVNVYPFIKVVLRYNKLGIGRDNETWFLVQPAFIPGKEIVLISMEDFDTSPEIYIQNNDTYGGLYKLDNDTMIVTNTINDLENDKSEPYILVIEGLGGKWDNYNNSNNSNQSNTSYSRQITIHFENSREPLVLENMEVNDLQDVIIARNKAWVVKYSGMILVSIISLFVILGLSTLLTIRITRFFKNKRSYTINHNRNIFMKSEKFNSVNSVDSVNCPYVVSYNSTLLWQYKDANIYQN